MAWALFALGPIVRFRGAAEAGWLAATGLGVVLAALLIVGVRWARPIALAWAVLALALAFFLPVNGISILVAAVFFLAWMSLEAMSPASRLLQALLAAVAAAPLLLARVVAGLEAGDRHGTWAAFWGAFFLGGR